MKNVFLLISLVLAVALFAFKKNIDNSDYETSYTEWLKFKSLSHNSYTYVAFHRSVLGGYRETKFTIKNGTITTRKFLSGSYELNTDSLIITKAWNENSSSLNTHGSEGDELLTLDEVYIKAKTVWLNATTKQKRIYFESKNSGLISLAGYVVNSCIDDCFTGIAIKNINAL